MHKNTLETLYVDFSGKRIFGICLLRKYFSGSNFLGSWTQVLPPLIDVNLIASSFHLQVGPTFKVIVLRDQEELDGPSQHKLSIVRNTCSHDSPAILRAIEQL